MVASGRSALIWERHYPVIFASLSVGVAVVFDFDIKLVEDIFSELITGSAIFIGFISTLAGIILTSQNKAIHFMKQINKLDGVMSYIWNSIRMLFVFIGLTITVQLISEIPYWLTLSWVFVGVLALTATFRSLDITLALLRSVARSTEK